ncbi:carbamoyl-phosphate synthase domain-containing protein [Leucobacter chinensis]|uniref:carbamoyl-phosphate synthase domain-containing protein n=1 Tax=Leucobacter chinensis TaxID=2851010 RepID=UPI001C2492AE
MTATTTSSAVLVLADGTRFEGRAYGSVGRSVGTLRLDVAPTGYLETLTDPKVAGEIVVFATPHIGATGVNDEDAVSSRIEAAGLVVRDPARRVSNFRATRSLDDDLARDEVVGISGIDTRALTRRIAAADSPLRAGIFSGADAQLSDAELATIVNTAA